MEQVRGLARRLAEWLPPSPAGRTAVAALGFGVAGALTAAVIVGVVAVPMGIDGQLNADAATLGTAFGLPLSAGVAGAVVGGLAWWLLVERTDSPSLGRGVAVGAAAGTLSHPVMWLLYGVGAVAFMVAERGAPVLASLDPGAVGGAVALYLVFTVFGFVLTAVLTVPAGVLAGLCLAYVRGKVEGPPGRGTVRDW